MLIEDRPRGNNDKRCKYSAGEKCVEGEVDVFEGDAEYERQNLQASRSQDRLFVIVSGASRLTPDDDTRYVVRLSASRWPSKS